jgi:hypothetical protein
MRHGSESEQAFRTASVAKLVLLITELPYKYSVPNASNLQGLWYQTCRSLHPGLLLDRRVVGERLFKHRPVSTICLADTCCSGRTPGLRFLLEVPVEEEMML